MALTKWVEFADFTSKKPTVLNLALATRIEQRDEHKTAVHFDKDNIVVVAEPYSEVRRKALGI